MTRGVTPPVGIGVIGHGFMGRAHAHALATLAHMQPLSRDVELVIVCGRDEARVAAMARQFGYRSWTCDWREVIEHPQVDAVANLTPNYLHEEIVLAAIAAGKHVLSEKPLGRNAAESKRMLEAATAAGVVHACGFNYRLLPAVRLANQLIMEGRLGKITHFRGQYLQDWGWQAPYGWHFDREQSGTGAIGDYVHVIDMARYLAGEIASVSAETATFLPVRTAADGSEHEIEIDDAYAAVGRLANGGLVSLESTRMAHGRKAAHTFEVNGSAGSVHWSLEDLNRLHLYFASDGDLGGFRDILVTEPTHPFLGAWWPTGHTLGWDHAFVNEWYGFLSAVIQEGELPTGQATFVDGWRADLVVDAIAQSAAAGRAVTVAAPEPGF